MTTTASGLLEPSSIKQEQEASSDGGAEDTPASASPPRPTLPGGQGDKLRSSKGLSRPSDQAAASTLSSVPSTSVLSTGATNTSTQGLSASSIVGSSAHDDITGRMSLQHPFSPVTLAAKGSYGCNGSSVGGGGGYSPHSTMNGTSTPSPPALSSPPAGSHDPLPPASSSSRDTQRQVAKVRRFLTTLQQFASEINADAGEKVRGLTLNLMSGLLSVEEFHLALQEVTHFPLRPFVLPFLRSHIPLLTRDLRRHATRHGMPVQQYVAVQETALLEAAAAAATGGEPGTDFFAHDPNTSGGSNGTTSAAAAAAAVVMGMTASGSNKRRHHSSHYFESGATDSSSSSPPPPKRLALFSPPFPPSMGGSSPDPPGLGSIPREGTSNPAAPHPVNDDEWKNIHMMLNCILSMVEKTRRALTILQQREDRDGGQARGAASTNEVRCRENDAEVRRHASELVAHAIRATEDRVAEVKRKAEEAVSEVRRAAVSEVQRAVSAADARAQELVAAERSRLEALIRELGRRDAGAEHRPDPHQACWNCGRKAHETCSGCNVARYCGPFCQHKDWDGHHKVCSPSLAVANLTSSSSLSASSSSLPSSSASSTSSSSSAAVSALLNNNSSATTNGSTTAGPIPSTVSHNGHHLTSHHPLAPKLATVTHKLLAKAAEITKME